MMTLTTW